MWCIEEMSKTYKHQATYDYLHNNKEVKGKLLKGIKKFFMNVISHDGISVEEVGINIKQDTTMKELINAAEELYKQIDKAQVHLINARLNNDEEDKKSAISEMETAMCNASQLLKCFIDRKDNIADLSEVWKDGNHIPRKDKKVVVAQNNGTFISGYLFIDKHTFTVEVNPFYIETSDIGNLYRWAYLDDLLPKGGEV